MFFHSTSGLNKTFYAKRKFGIIVQMGESAAWNSDNNAVPAHIPRKAHILFKNIKKKPN